MKLHLPLALRLALTSCFAFSSIPPISGTLSLALPICLLFTASPSQAVDYVISDSSSASAACSSTNLDTITFKMVHDSDASFNENYFPNATSSDISYTASSITIDHLDISNGYSSNTDADHLATYYFNATILGSGAINFYNWNNQSSFQEYVFTGDVSSYAGDITSSIADNVAKATYTGGLSLRFTGSSSLAAAGTGDILLRGTSGESVTFSYSQDTTIANGSISAPHLYLTSTGDSMTYTLDADVSAQSLNLSSTANAVISAGHSLDISDSLTMGSGSTLRNEGSINLSGSISITQAGQIINNGSLSLSSDLIFDLSGLQEGSWVYDAASGRYSLSLIGGLHSYDLSNFDEQNISGFDVADKDIRFNDDGSLSYLVSLPCYFFGGQLTLQDDCTLRNESNSSNLTFHNGYSITFSSAAADVSLAEDVFVTSFDVAGVDVSLQGNGFTLDAETLNLQAESRLTISDDVLSSTTRVVQAEDAGSEFIVDLDDASDCLDYGAQLSGYSGDITLSSGSLSLQDEAVAAYHFGVISVLNASSQLSMSGQSSALALNMTRGGSLVLADGASLTTGGGAIGNSSNDFLTNLVKHTGAINVELGSGALLDQKLRLWLDTGASLSLNVLERPAVLGTYRVNELLLRYTDHGDAQTSVSIGAGTQLEITGTLAEAGNANSSFVISGHTTGSSLVTVKGLLTLNSGIVSLGGSNNVINIAAAGILQANAGLVAYDSSDSSVEIELNLQQDSVLMLGNQATQQDHSDAMSVNLMGGNLVTTNGKENIVYVYQALNFAENESYTVQAGQSKILQLMQKVSSAGSTFTVGNTGITGFLGGLDAHGLIVQDGSTTQLTGGSSLNQMTAESGGGTINLSTAAGKELMLGSLALSGGSISLAEGASMSENRMQDVSLEGVTMAIADNMYMASSSIGQQSTVTIADGATLSLGEQISISSASAGGATVTMNKDSSLSDSYMSNTALSYLSLDNADVRITSNADTDSLLLQRITSNANSSLTITSGSKVNVTGFSSYLRGSTIIESGAEANMGTMCAIYGRFEAQDNSKLVFGGGSFNSGASLYLGKGAQMEAVNTKFNTGATLYLDGAAITLQDKYRWFYSDIVITGAGNSISGTTTFLGLASELSYSQAWTGSDDWTLNLDGNAQLSINYVFTIDFSVDGEASLGAGSYTIFSNVANDCTSSLTADMVSGVLRDDYELVWRYEDGNIILDVIDMSELIWSDAEQTWVDGLGNQATPDSNQSLSFDTGTISGGSATLSDSIEASGISIKGDEDVHIMGDVTLSSQSSITKSGAGTAVVEAQLSATQGVAIEQGRLELSKTGRITSDTQVAQGASLKAGAITLTGKEGMASIGVSAGGSISCDEMGHVQISNATLVVDGIAQISNSSLEASSTQITAGSQLILDGVHIAANSQFSTSISYLKANSQAAQLSLMGANTIDASSSGGSLSIRDGVYTLTNLMEVDTIALDGSLTINLILSEQEMLDFNLANQSLQGVSFIIMDGVIEGQLNDLIINVGTMLDGIYDATCVYQGEGDLDDGVLSVTLNGDDNVPEPSTVSLSLMALAGILARRRRRA